MTYYSDQVAGARKSIAEALSGKRLRDSIRQLQERSKIGNSLKPLQARGALTAKKKIGTRAAASAGQMLSPFTEIAGSRTFHETERQLWSSDGLFLLSYFNVKQIQMLDAGNQTVIFNYDDYTAS